MQFKEIKPNYNIYALNKKDFSILKGKVKSISPARMEINRMSGKSEIVIDADITIDEVTKTFTIPETLSVTYAGDIVLSTTLQGLSQDVESVIASADQVLASVDRAKMVKEKSASVLAEINPTFKEKQETEIRFGKIEDSMSEMKDLMKKQQEMIENFINKLG